MSEHPDGMVEMVSDTVAAVGLKEVLAAGEFPSEAAWSAAPPVRFSADWRGRNEDSQRETQVRLLWNQLWDHDVCEAFLQPDPSQPRRYTEFEVAPNGFWIDLDIGPAGKSDLRSGLRRLVEIDQNNRTWSAVLAVRMDSLTPRFDPSAVWRCNFYRVEGQSEPRFYSAWQPTRTKEPNFHVPEAFGRLLFVAGPEALLPGPVQ